MAGLGKMMAPAMMGMSVGSMVGNLARRAFGVYDLPIPRATPALVLVPANIDTFAAEWSIQLDEMRLWVLAHELAGLTLFSIDHIADHLRSLVQRHVGAFRPDPSAITDKLTSLEMDQSDPMAAMQQAFGDPEVLLGAVRSPEQAALEPELDAAVAVTIGAIDWVVDAVSVRIIGGNALQIAEAVRRRRGRDVTGRHLRRAAARHPLGRGADRPRQGIRAGCGRSGRRERTRAVLHRSGGGADPERDRGARPLARPRDRRVTSPPVRRPQR